MGQPRVASATWRERNRRISQDFYEIVGQQILQTSASKPMRAWSHVKILNRVFKSTPDIPSETERNQLNFSASGMPLIWIYSWIELFRPGGRECLVVIIDVQLQANANLMQVAQAFD